jgi:uncharacterized protein YecT (DUF1311 family)
MIRKKALLAVSLLLPVAVACARPSTATARIAQATSVSPATSAAWLLDYEGKSTNALVGDKRIKPLVANRIPRALADDVLGSLGGPPDPVIVAGRRYVSMSACRPHACPEKGFLWVDTQSSAALGAHFLDGDLLLGSNGMTAQAMPPAAKRALSDWLSGQNLRTTRAAFVGRSEQRTALAAVDFTARDAFVAPPTGPSFDCRRAGSPVETAICGDKDLAARDLALNALYDEVRQGSDTVSARTQLQGLQRSWLKERDRDCTDARRMAACLAAQYDAQRKRLENWVPTR